MSPYRAADGVHWIVGRSALTVVDRRGAARVVGYPEAAVWDFVVRGYSMAETSTLVAAVAARDVTDAADLVRSAIDGWVGAGLLERV